MVKRLVECIQFNTNSTVDLFNSTPQYIIITIFAICFLIVIGVFGLIFYYIYRKFKSIDNYIDKKYDDLNHDNNDTETYKKYKKAFKKDIYELEAKILPDEQTVNHIVDKVIEFKNKN